MYKRTLVAVKNTEKTYKVAKFIECLVCLFDPLCNSTENRKTTTLVKCKLENDLLKISPVSTDSQTKSLSSIIRWDDNMGKFSETQENYVMLHHSPECPITHLTQNEIKIMPDAILNRGIDVAVSVLVESNDCKLLMTRRSNHMRTFARAWVPPGGHIEENESLVDAGLRELKEETGLYLDKHTKINILCLWESVYPPMLGMGTPTRHHVVVYLLAKSSKSSSEITSSLQLDPEEVQACTWLTPESVNYLITGGALNDELLVPSQKMFVLQDNKLIEDDLNLKTMFHPTLWAGTHGEIYSGSQLVLNTWYHSLNKSKL